MNFTNQPTVVARTAVLVAGATVTTTTTVPEPLPTTNHDRRGRRGADTGLPRRRRRGCDDGDPCTTDTCVTNAGCWSRPVEGLESVTCTCERPLPAACADETLPASIGRRQGRAGSLFSGAGPSGTKRLRRGTTMLNGAVALVSKAQKKGKLSADCAGALKAELLDAKDRAARFLGTSALGRP